MNEQTMLEWLEIAIGEVDENAIFNIYALRTRFADKNVLLTEMSDGSKFKIEIKKVK